MRSESTSIHHSWILAFDGDYEARESNELIMKSMSDNDD